MKTIVVTGSTRGIGRGLVENFARLGCNIVLNGRSETAVRQAVDTLAKQFGSDRITGKAGDITSPDDLQALWNHACKTFGTVDVWINNAGISIKRQPIQNAPFADLERIVDINLKGVLFACRVAASGMLQQGYGQIWNMEGFGSTGAVQPGMAGYGATKRAVHYLNKALLRDLKGTPVQVCALSPGIVVTDLLVSDYDAGSDEWERAKKIFNILGDHVDTVTPWLAQQVLATNATGKRVAWLTSAKAFARFATAGFRKRDLFRDLGTAKA